MTTPANLLTDHPELYEARFPDPERLAGRWTEDCLRRYGAGPRVLDLGCGTGRDAAHLHSAGRRVTGADLSRRCSRTPARTTPDPRTSVPTCTGSTWAGAPSTRWCAWTARCCTATPTTSSTAA
ncbi:hypothetical protein GCM10020295_09240 [Streptomyces cinereospinus]